MQANILPTIGEGALAAQQPHSTPVKAPQGHVATNSKMIPSMLPRDNFWEVGAYRRVVKRIDDGAALIDEFRTMVQERAAIEKKHAAMLSDWAARWESKVEKSNECQEFSIFNAWHGLINEANSTAELHSQSDSKLDDLANRHISAWKKANFPKVSKAGMKKYKATKQAEDGFDKAQKGWGRMHGKFFKSKKAWKQNIKLVESVEKKLASKNSLSAEDRAKLIEKQKKLHMMAEQNKFKCEQRLTQLQEDEARYRADMREQFLFCQDIEQKRIEFLKHAMSLHINSLPQRADTTMTNVLRTIDNINADADLVKYAEVKGEGMPLMMPTMELDDGAEFDRRMSMGRSSGSQPATPKASKPKRESLSIPALIDTEVNDDSDSDDDWEAAVPELPEMRVSTSSVTDSSHNSSQDASNTDMPAFTVPAPPKELGVPEPVPRTPEPELQHQKTFDVTADTNAFIAMYEYQAAEPEELSLAVGDVIVELESEDDQGWCKGRDKHDNIGYYPAYYVERVRREAIA